MTKRQLRRAAALLDQYRPTKREQERIWRALVRLRDAAEDHGNSVFYEVNNEDFNKTGRAMIRSLEQADRAIKSVMARSGAR